MNLLRAVTTGTTLLIVGGCTDGPTVPDPTARTLEVSALTASASRKVEASGAFVAEVDFSTITFTPRGRNCLLQVEGRLIFSGTVAGVATGRTSALVFAPCSEVATTAPGTFPDVFKSELAFEGTVDSQSVHANVLYMGRVQRGGRIEGRLVFANGVSGRLEADAVVAVGGTYRGSLVVH